MLPWFSKLTRKPDFSIYFLSPVYKKMHLSAEKILQTKASSYTVGPAVSTE